MIKTAVFITERQREDARTYVTTERLRPPVASARLVRRRSNQALLAEGLNKVRGREIAYVHVRTEDKILSAGTPTTRIVKRIVQSRMIYAGPVRITANQRGW